MYFARVSSDTMVDLERVWCMSKRYDDDGDSVIEFTMSDETVLNVTFEDEEVRDTAFETIMKIYECLNKYHYKDMNNDK